MVDAALDAPAIAGARRRSTLRRSLQRKSTIAFLMALPLILLIALLVLYPALYSVHLATLNKSMERFVGFGNFSFLFKRETFWMVVQQSCIFAVTAVIFKALIGFIVAHFVHNIPAKGQRKWRGMLLVPWVIPPAMSALAWLWLFDPSYSAFNWLLALFGIGPCRGSARPYWARFSVILVNVWFGAPFFMIMYLAALKSVPEQLYEAAAIDGANWWQKHVVHHAADDAQHHRHHRAVLADRHLRQLRHRAHPDGRRPDRPDARVRHLGVLGRHPGQRHPARRRVSLFMFPILAVAAIFILRDINTPGGRNVMTAASLTTEATSPRARKHGSMQPRPPLGAALVVFLPDPVRDLLPDAAGLHADHVAEDQRGDLGRHQPVVGASIRRCSNYVELLTSPTYLTFFRNSALVSVFVVTITMLISIPAAFALSRMKFWGSATLATGVFLTYLIPETLLFIPLFKIFALVQRATGHRADQSTGGCC